MSLNSNNPNRGHNFQEIEVESESPEYYEIMAPYSVPENEEVVAEQYNQNIQTVSVDDNKCSRSGDKPLEIIFLIDVSPSIAPAEESGLDGMFKYIQRNVLHKICLS